VPAGVTQAIVAKDVAHTYRGGKRAVDGVSFEVRKGEFFGFLGPNGAGKSTTIKMLATLLYPDEGSVVVNGLDTQRQPVAVRRSIGYTAQDTSVDEELTARENVRFACEAYGVPRAQREARIEQLLRLVDLLDVADKRASTFSGGMRKRLDIATSLVHDPPLLFLDEPTTGLDPKARTSLWAYFRELNRRGTTIFLTTQYLEEADQLCERIAILNEGRIVATGSPAQLKAMVGGDALEIHLEITTPDTVERARAALAKSGLLSKEDAVGSSETALTVTSPHAKRIGADVLGTLKKEGFAVLSFNVRSPTLDDVFLKLTGATLEEAQEKAKATAPAPGRGGHGRRR
jgi:ABC-2 type transport system ATP-binding protein